MRLTRKETLYYPKRTFMHGVVTGSYVFLSYSHGSILAYQRKERCVAWEMPAKRWEVFGAIHDTLILENDDGDLIRGVEPATGRTRWLASGRPRIEGESLYICQGATELTVLDPSTGVALETWELPGTAMRHGAGRVLLRWPETACALYDLSSRRLLWRRDQLMLVDSPGPHGLWLLQNVVVQQEGEVLEALHLETGEVAWRWPTSEPMGQAYCLLGYIFLKIGRELVAIASHTGRIAWTRPLADFGECPPGGIRYPWRQKLIATGPGFNIAVLDPASGQTVGAYSKTPNFVWIVPGAEDLLLIRNYGRADVVGVVGSAG